MTWTVPQLIRRTRRWCHPCAKWRYFPETVATAKVNFLKHKGINLSTYRCPLGGGYHLTHKKQPR